MNKLHIQPCWTCKKCYGGCSWSRKDPEPVPGWDATPTVKTEYEWDGTEEAHGE